MCCWIRCSSAPVPMAVRRSAGGLKGRRVHPHSRLIVIPGSQEVYLDAIREGIIADLVEAGAAVGTPSCGPCFGGSMGILARKVLSTTNRNFVGRMALRKAKSTWAARRWLRHPPFWAVSPIRRR